MRVSLNQQQITDHQDSILAHRLQYGHLYGNTTQPPRAWRVPPRGRLHVSVMEARLAKNYGFTKMDPYIKITLDGKIFETETDEGAGKNPRWNKTIVWSVECFLFFFYFLISIYIFMFSCL